MHYTLPHLFTRDVQSQTFHLCATLKHNSKRTRMSIMGHKQIYSTKNGYIFFCESFYGADCVTAQHEFFKTCYANILLLLNIIFVFKVFSLISEVLLNICSRRKKLTKFS